MRTFSRNRAEYKKTTSLTRVWECDRKRAYWLSRMILDGRAAKLAPEYASLIGTERIGLVILPPKNLGPAPSIEWSVLRSANFAALDCACEF